MGVDKCFVVHDGAPLVRRIADALDRAGASDVRCIGGDLGRLRALALGAEPDAHPGEGPLGAVIQALSAAENDQLTVILAVDLLRPDAATIRSLVDVAAAEPSDVVVPEAGGRLQVLHAVWRRSALSHLSSRFDAGVRSLTTAISGLGEVRTIGRPPAAFVDADTPEQLRYPGSDRAEDEGR